MKAFNQSWGPVILLFLVISLLAGCGGNQTNNERPAEPLPDADTVFMETASSIREIAWTQLSEHAKKTVNGDWKEAEVTVARWEDVPVKKTKAIPESVYKVTFNTSYDELLGPIGIYFDPTSKSIVGYDARK